MRRLSPLASPLLVLALLAGCVDSTISSNNTPPEAVIDLPAPGTAALVDTDVLFEGRVQDRVTPGNEISVRWTSSRDGVLLDGFAAADGTTTFSTDALTAGEHTITLRALDAEGASGTASVALDVVVDQPPEIEIEAPETSDVLYASLPVSLRASVDDLEDPLPELRVSWRVEGGDALVTGAVPSGSGETLDTVSLVAGAHVLVAEVTDTAGNVSSDAVSVTVLPGGPNTPPTTTAPAVTPDPDLYTDSVASCSGAVGSDDDGDDVTITYTWEVEGNDPGVTGDTLDGANFSKGRTVVCIATPNDELVDGTPVASAGVLVLNSPPSAPGVALTPGSPTTDDALACTVSAATDADGDALSYSVTWAVGGVPAPTYDATGLAAGDVATVPSGATTTGETWECTASADDGDVTGASASASATVGCAPGSGTEAACPGLSCLTILNDGYSTGDDWYWIDPTASGAFQAYCDQTTAGGGWTRIVDHDYSVDACPGAWVGSSQGGGSCVRATSGSGTFIRSATFDAFGITWTELGGRGTGWQYASCDAFGDNPPSNIEDTYGDVVSFTIGAPGSREHLFSYVCGFGTNGSDDSNCPSGPGGAPSPGFVGGDYLCDTGNQSGSGPSGTWQPGVMWDNVWWQSSANASTTDDVEGRLIATSSSSDEDLAVGTLELYVR